MKYLCSILALAFTASVAAIPTTVRHDYVVHEKRTNIKRARSYASIDRRGVVPMSIGLKQRNLEFGDEYLMKVSDPNSPSYGQHWSADKVAETFAASPESVDAVLSWLGNSGISRNRISVHKGQHWVQFDASISEAENLLQTEYKVYTHPQSGKPVLGCDKYSIPSSLVDHVDFITPTVNDGPAPVGLKKRQASRSKKGKRTNSSIKPTIVHVGPVKAEDSTISFSNVTNSANATGLASCTNTTSIECMRFLYNMPVGTSSLSSFAVMEFDSTFLQSDLDLFYANNPGSTVPSGTAPVVTDIDGGVAGASGDDFGEGTLDLVVGIPLVYPQPVTIYEVGSSSQNATFGNFLDALDATICATNNDSTSTDCGNVKPADVISISWGGSEDGNTPAFNTRQCYEYLKLGLQGSTVLFSSGDNGVNSLGGNCTTFQVQFPASCPYITSVGATTLTSPNPPTLPEIATNGFGSGGGFSNIFPLPSYQASAVTTYLQNTPPPYTSSQFNNSGAVRGYPDISANGQWIDYFVKGKETEEGGTSMSAPLVGSLVTLINQERIKAGKGSVGFLNPVLYANPGALNDVVSGVSNPVEGEEGCGTKGFETAVGWDPVTGLGTPDYEKLLPVFMALP